MFQKSPDITSFSSTHKEIISKQSKLLLEEKFETLWKAYKYQMRLWNMVEVENLAAPAPPPDHHKIVVLFVFTINHAF